DGLPPPPPNPPPSRGRAFAGAAVCGVLITAAIASGALGATASAQEVIAGERTCRVLSQMSPAEQEEVRRNAAADGHPIPDGADIEICREPIPLPSLEEIFGPTDAPFRSVISWTPTHALSNRNEEATALRGFPVLLKDNIETAE